MKDVINKLANKCKSMSDSKKMIHFDIYGEIVNSILEGNYEEAKKLDLLVELYRYAYYSEIRTSLDPRGDAGFKLSILTKTKGSLLKNEISSEIIDEFKEINNYMREFIDSPVEFIKSEIKFYTENPYAKF